MGINFPASPTVGQKYPQPAVAGIPVYTWDGEKWTTVGGSIAAYAPPADAVPLVNAGAGLVGTSTDYAREDHVHPADASLLAYSGMQINGGMEINQAGTINAPASGQYCCDGWVLLSSGIPGIQATCDANSDVPGFQARIFSSTSTAKPSLAADDYLAVAQPIEGYRVARLSWGTASAQPITIGFWTNHTLAGVYTVAVRNAAANRSYAATYTQNVANAHEYKIVTIPGDTGGTWLTTNGVGIYVFFTAACGATLTAPAANTWTAGNYLAAPGQVNVVASSSNFLILRGVTVLPGTQAPTAAQSPNIMRPYDQELVTCQRYYEQETNLFIQGMSAGFLGVPYNLKVTKRAAPTASITQTSSDGSGTTISVLATRPDLITVRLSVAISNGWAEGTLYADARL